jgi:hypothetical protein
MTLQSKLLSKDPRLESCLISDAAHIMRGSHGAHVANRGGAAGTIGTAAVAKVAPDGASAPTPTMRRAHHATYAHQKS